MRSIPVHADVRVGMRLLISACRRRYWACLPHTDPHRPACCCRSGKHGGHCSVRGNDGSYSPMPADEVTVGKLLSRKGGYVTAIVGKWGEGDHGTTGYPLGAGGGFDEFIGQDTQVGCHNWYPSNSTKAGGALWNGTSPMEIPANTDASYASCSTDGTHRAPPIVRIVLHLSLDPCYQPRYPRPRQVHVGE
jgi:arylsulfatase A-like enzyme